MHNHPSCFVTYRTLFLVTHTRFRCPLYPAYCNIITIIFSAALEFYKLAHLD